MWRLRKNKMKNLILIAIISTFSGLINIASAQNVTIPDANFKAALVANTAINTNSDTEIQVTEATSFAGTMNVGYLNITDLTGIEAFTAVDSLICNVNQLTSIDISTCTALRYLNCDYNALTSLDVSSNTLLTGLNCTNNPLTSLDVTANTALVVLGCGGNRITSLDVSQNTALTTLVCFYDSIGSLDVSANTQLTYFDCSYNKLTSLNIQNGNNSNFYPTYGFNAKHNPNLTCIQVDDTVYMNANWSNKKDTTASFSIDCTTTGIANLSNIDDKITIYPNPFSTQAIIAFSEEQRNTTIKITDILGQEMKAIHFAGRQLVLDKVEMKAGIYFVQITDDNNRISNKKIIVQ
jgi:Leucine-rich repeat (LRR) protein